MGPLLLNAFSVILDVARITCNVCYIPFPILSLCGTSVSSIFERKEFFDFHLDQLPIHIKDDKTCWPKV